MSSDNGSKPPKAPKMVVDFDLLRAVAGTNFRDLGGHRTRQGRIVRREMVYRSAHLAEVPEQSPLRSVGLRTVVTLQSRFEVAELGAPDNSILQSVRWEHIPLGDRWFQDPNFAELTDAPGREHLALVVHFREVWRAFFRLLAERNVYPLLFHCSAGRDRTGVGAAMLLELLGVERERIVADFLASNLVFTRALLSAAQLDPLFAAIDERGGIDCFMGEVIGLERCQLAAIRGDLLAD